MKCLLLFNKEAVTFLRIFQNVKSVTYVEHFHHLWATLFPTFRKFKQFYSVYYLSHKF
jgi:hypothetical protein